MGTKFEWTAGCASGTNGERKKVSADDNRIKNNNK